MTIYRKQGRRYMPVEAVTLEDAWGMYGLIATSAVRYCLGSMTYIVGSCADWLTRVWPTLPERAREIIRCDVEEAFAQDDKGRAEGGQRKCFGWDCDREQWERVRRLWT